MTSPDVTLKRRQTGNTNPLAHCPQKGKPAKLVENCPHTGNSAICLITGTGSSAKSLAQQAILPNHWHTPPHASNSAKSLAHCPQTYNFTKSLAQAILPHHWHSVHRQTVLPNHWNAPPHTYNSAKSLAHCPHTDNSAKSLAQAIMTNHWHAPQHTGYSAKSLAHCPQTNNSAKSPAQAIIPNHLSFACSSTYWLFCQITGTLLHKLAILPNHWHRQFCQITGTMST